MLNNKIIAWILFPSPIHPFDPFGSPSCDSHITTLWGMSTLTGVCCICIGLTWDRCAVRRLETGNMRAVYIQVKSCSSTSPWFTSLVWVGGGRSHKTQEECRTLDQRHGAGGQCSTESSQSHLLMFISSSSFIFLVITEVWLVFGVLKKILNDQKSVTA